MTQEETVILIIEHAKKVLRYPKGSIRIFYRKIQTKQLSQHLKLLT